ncbi:MAG: TonB-dependent receptor [Acidobacteriota bacterium]
MTQEATMSLRFARDPSTARIAIVLFFCTGAALLSVFTPLTLLAEESGSEVFGRVVRAGTGDPVAGITVELAELGLSTLTDSEGRFSFADIPPGQFTLALSSAKFVPEQFRIEVPSAAEIQLAARPLPVISESVTVTAAPWKAESLAVAQTTYAVDAGSVRTRSGLSIGEAIKDVPGVRNISTGDASGVPMIRGQTNERIRVLSNGIFHDYFQFSRRHMANIEPYEADRIEVVSGPASVLYGTQAIGGVVNLVSAPLPFPVDDRPVFSGEGILGYAGVNGAKILHAQIDGGRAGFAGRASLTHRATGNMGTPAGDLPNTDYDQQSASLEGGYQSEKGMMVTGHFRHWQNDLGFYIPLQPNFRLGLQNEIGGVAASLPATWGLLQLDANLSRNIRRAFPLGRSHGAKVDLELDTQLYRASFQHNPVGPLARGVVRLEHSRQSNETFGPVKLLPYYENRTWSAMVFEEAGFGRREKFDHWTLNAGLRIDRRTLDVPADTILSIPDKFEKTYQALTGGAGVVYRFNRVISTGVSISRGWRNPSEFELFANGPHDGVQLYEKGNPNLQEETNLNTEFTLRCDHERVRGSVAVYRAVFANYIYLRLTGETIGGLPVSTFDQSDAVVSGVEGRIEMDATPFLSLRALGETLQTHNDDTGKRLPFTPPVRAGFSVRIHDFAVGSWSSPFVELRSTWTGRGTIAGPDEPFPLDTESYVLFDLAAGGKRELGKSVLCIDLWIGNLANKSYKDFLDTYKQYALSAGRNTRLTLRLLF